jgi:Transposase, Mutator family
VHERPLGEGTRGEVTVVLAAGFRYPVDDSISGTARIAVALNVEKFWAGVCAELANRGVADVLIVCCDGLTGFPEAIRPPGSKRQSKRAWYT